jgi:hypothetical protein
MAHGAPRRAVPETSMTPSLIRRAAWRARRRRDPGLAACQTPGNLGRMPTETDFMTIKPA